MALFIELNVQTDSLFPSQASSGKKQTNTPPPPGQEAGPPQLPQADSSQVSLFPRKFLRNTRGQGPEPPSSVLIHVLPWHLGDWLGEQDKANETKQIKRRPALRRASGTSAPPGGSSLGKLQAGAFSLDQRPSSLSLCTIRAARAFPLHPHPGRQARPRFCAPKESASIWLPAFLQ